VTASMWWDAIHALEAQLVCPCGAMNSPTLRPIALDGNGNAACDGCGRGGPVQLFLPDHLKERR
jgi:hypothetical protein